MHRLAGVENELLFLYRTGDVAADDWAIPWTHWQARKLSIYKYNYHYIIRCSGPQPAANDLRDLATARMENRHKRTGTYLDLIESYQHLI